MPPRPPKPPSGRTNPDFASTSEDAAILNLDVLANDSRGLRTVAPAGEWTSSRGAVITRNADGTLNYDPTRAPSLQALQVGESVTDTFTYTAVDKKGNTYTEIVTITVAGANDAPVATPDSYTVLEGTTLTVAASSGLLANDFDPEGDPIFALDYREQPANGHVTIFNDGSLVYTPNTNFHGTDTFEYRAATVGYSSVADISPYTRVTIDVTPAEDAPAGTISNITNGADNHSFEPAVSGDGNTVVFHSFASNLAGSGHYWGLFVYNMSAGTLMKIPAPEGSAYYSADISADGSTVAFVTLGENHTEIAVHDMTSGSTRTITEGSDSSSTDPRISGDGSKVVFYSYATNLVPGEADENALPDVFLFDAATGATTNVTLGGNGGSYSPVISVDGSKIVFYSDATNLGETDLNDAMPDIFLYDVATGVVTNITNGGNNVSRFADISADGSKIVFESAAGNLVAGQSEAPDDNDLDIFLFDVATGITSYVTAGGMDYTEASISGDGSTIAYRNVPFSFGSSERTDFADVFLFDLSSGTTTNITEGDGDSFAPDLSHDGSVVAFYGAATNLIDNEADLNGSTYDVFVYELV